MSNLHSLLDAQSVAIVGDSLDQTWGFQVREGLRRFGYQGKVFPVNPKYTEIRGLTCYPKVTAIPEPVDCVVIGIPARFVIPTVREGIQQGAKAAVIFASGFGEADEAGKQRHAELSALAKEHDLSICGPNCFGLINVHSGATFYGGPLRDRLIPGPIALVSQSGGFLISLTEPATERGIGFSYIISAGNQIATEVADYVDFLVDDPKTTVIAAFIEGLRNPARFLRAADRALAAGKPLIAVKVGRSPRAQRATLAHTGSLAGSDATIDAVFRQKGIIRVNDLDELLETAILFSKAKPLRGRGVGVITGSGGGCGLFSDLAESIGVPLIDYTAETKAELTKILPDFGTPDNPLDATGAMFADMTIFDRCLRLMAKDPNVDLIASYQSAAKPPESNPGMRRIANIVAAAAKDSDRLFVPFSGTSSGALDPVVFETLNAAGVPFLLGARDAWRAIKSLLDYQEFTRERGDDKPAVLAGLNRPEAARILAQSSGALSEYQSKLVLAKYGIPVTRERLVNSPAEAAQAAENLGYPVVLKVSSADILHKSEAGALMLNLRNAEEVSTAYAAILANASKYNSDARIEGVLVQEMLAGGTEIIAGISQDRQFGPVLLCGLGGIFVEVLKDTVLRVPPITPAIARNMVSELKAAAILQGARGRPPADVSALVDVLLRLAQFAIDFADSVAAVDINPLVVMDEGQGVKAADALIVLKQA